MQEIIYAEEGAVATLLQKALVYLFVYACATYIAFILFLAFYFGMSFEKIILMWNTSSLMDKILVSPLIYVFGAVAGNYFAYTQALAVKPSLTFTEQGVTYTQGKLSRFVSWADYTSTSYTMLINKTKPSLFKPKGSLVVLDVFDKNVVATNIETFKQKYVPKMP
jgi:hypothetical protein